MENNHPIAQRPEKPAQGRELGRGQKGFAGNEEVSRRLDVAPEVGADGEDADQIGDDDRVVDAGQAERGFSHRWRGPNASLLESGSTSEGVYHSFGMEIRTLEASERKAALDLLDLWELEDGWRGRDFFRRYFEDDPTFEDRNVWVAVDRGGRLRSCVQIFPRQIRLHGRVVPCGGIGSVFTHPQCRRSGLATRVLRCAADDMRRRGFEISLLFAVRIAWYTELGWRSYEQEQVVLRWPAGESQGRSSGLEIRPFEPSLDLTSVRSIHDEYASSFDGGVIRDAELWQSSLALAGNPDEDFWVGVRSDAVVSYARRTVLGGRALLIEWGCRDGREADLASLVEGWLSAAAPESSEAELVLPAAGSAVPEWLLAAGFESRRESYPSLMLWALRPSALARRLNVRMKPEESANDYLFRLLQGRRFCFWPADRF